ncbi:MAG: phenylalanine--tRNA ligase subunit beta [Phycisphaerae bacterium]|nr:phenylalanine--tRNA ligase subunit beta [Phycisphaerae bacterium]
MLISLNWLKDFVGIPADLSPRELADRLTMSTAEVEGVKQVVVQANDVIAAKVVRVGAVPEKRRLSHAVLDVGGREVETVTAALNLRPGHIIAYAPEGTTVGVIGKIERTTVAGLASVGMILPGEALGILQTTQEAVFLPPSSEPGSVLDVTELNDWVLEIDNKSVTHRPDLWGHYGIAREVAALLDRPLRAYEELIVPLAGLENEERDAIPIVIDDPTLCPRYSALTMTGMLVQPSPLWMQARLSHVGQRPIDLLVDLTNYIMFDVGQPTHAFDGERVTQIEVAVAKPGETFLTLDGMERKLPKGTLMIQSGRKNVALAGIMGGAETEVTAETKTVLLESANFEPATIRRAAAVMGHRTEASARFEKALDPANTVLGIGRFVKLAVAELPEFRVVSTLSDCYPAPKPAASVEVDLGFANRFIGAEVPRDRVERILTSLGFRCEPSEGDRLLVHVPSYRATRDVAIEADIIEEISRIVGYGNIPDVLPNVTMRSFTAVPAVQVDRRSLELLCGGLGFNEVHTYIWYDQAWLDLLGFEPGECIEIAGASAGGRRLRHTVMPQLVAAAELNRRYFDRFKLVTIGSVFLPEPDPRQDWPGRECRHMGLAAVSRGNEDLAMEELKRSVELWSRQILHRPVAFAEPGDSGSSKPWEHPIKTSDVMIDGRCAGRLTLVPLECRLKIDEHLRRWAIALAEVDLDVAAEVGQADESLCAVPTRPQAELDFSVLADVTHRYATVSEAIGQFEHPLLRRLTLVECYEGKNIPDGKRSLTFRAQVGSAERTLTDEDLQGFREAFTAHLAGCGLALRA